MLQTYGELTPDVCVVHYAKLLAAGIHVYHSLSGMYHIHVLSFQKTIFYWNLIERL